MKKNNMSSKVEFCINTLLVFTILFSFVCLFMDDYIKIPALIAGIYVGVFFILLSILGLMGHTILFTRAEPVSYGTSIIGKIINIMFGILGIAIIVMVILMETNKLY